MAAQDSWRHSFCLFVGFFLLVWNTNLILMIMCLGFAAKRDQRYENFKKQLRVHHTAQPLFIIVASLLLIMGIIQNNPLLIVPFLVVYTCCTLATIVELCYTMCCLWFTIILPLIVLVSTMCSLLILVTTFELYQEMSAALEM